MDLSQCQCGHDHDGDDVEGEDDVDRGAPVANGQEYLHKNSNNYFLLQDTTCFGPTKKGSSRSDEFGGIIVSSIIITTAYSIQLTHLRNTG